MSCAKKRGRASGNVAARKIETTLTLYHPDLEKTTDRSDGRAILRPIPPANMQAEAGVLAALMDKRFRDEVLAALPPWRGAGLFAHRPHGQAFDAIQRGEGIRLTDREWIKLADADPACWRYWLRVLLEAATRRRLAMGAVILCCAAQNGTPIEELRNLTRQIADVAKEGLPCAS